MYVRAICKAMRESPYIWLKRDVDRCGVVAWHWGEPDNAVVIDDYEILNPDGLRLLTNLFGTKFSTPLVI